MSDIDVWPAKTTVEQIGAGIADLQRRIDSLAARMAARAHDFRGDDSREARDLLVQIVGELRALDPAGLVALLPQYTPPAVHENHGEDTRAWLANQVPVMRRNSGSWGAR